MHCDVIVDDTKILNKLIGILQMLVTLFEFRNSVLSVTFLYLYVLSNEMLSHQTSFQGFPSAEIFGVMPKKRVQ